MSTLVIDIETVGEEWGDLDAITQDTLLRWVKRTARNKDEELALTTDVQAGLGFSPLTGKTVAIGLWDVERSQGAVYYTGEAGAEDEEFSGFILKQRNEYEMLNDFWQGAKQYHTFVTFNGRGFDIPFLVHRSIALGIRPTKNLLEGRYPYQQKSARHVDLQDELTFYGAMSKRPSLHLFCRAYGIKSPKQEVSGDDVAELFRQKKFRHIAEYNAADVIATTELYQRWQEFLRPNDQAEEPSIHY